jgi:hypothetical protein
VSFDENVVTLPLTKTEPGAHDTAKTEHVELGHFLHLDGDVGRCAQMARINFSWR